MTGKVVAVLGIGATVGPATGGVGANDTTVVGDGVADSSTCVPLANTSN